MPQSSATTPPEQEEQRFLWMREHEIISDEEYSIAIEQINFDAPRDFEEP